MTDHDVHAPVIAHVGENGQLIFPPRMTNSYLNLVGCKTDPDTPVGTKLMLLFIHGELRAMVVS